MVAESGQSNKIPFEDAAKVCRLILGFAPTGILYGSEQVNGEQAEFVEFVDSLYSSVKMDYYWLEDHLCELKGV